MMVYGHWSYLFIMLEIVNTRQKLKFENDSRKLCTRTKEK